MPTVTSVSGIRLSSSHVEGPLATIVPIEPFTGAVKFVRAGKNMATPSVVCESQELPAKASAARYAVCGTLKHGMPDRAVAGSCANNESAHSVYLTQATTWNERTNVRLRSWSGRQSQ